MKTIKIMLIPALVVMISLGIPTMIYAKHGGFPGAEPVYQMVEEIKSMNLINSLYLTTDQKSELISIGKEAKHISDEQVKNFDVRRDKFLEILREIKSEIKKNGPNVSRDLAIRFHRLQDEMMTITKENQDRIKILVNRAKNVLTDNQKVLVEEYHPCVIPVKDLRNPERVGQANSSGFVSRLLERARKIPENQYPRFKQTVLDRARKKISIKLYIPEEEREKSIENLGRALDEARRLSPVDFELRKDELAGSFMPHMKKNGNELDRKIEKFLISPGALKVLQGY
ncbi:MAG: hypothetical protein J7M18_04945 [Candidatus Eremiobacteraeota bacterium]|nr:hypothetical protein [Candidatus Eremiobacteraeota bacterium]